MGTVVVNIKDRVFGAVSIMRGTPWGNPFPITAQHNRDWVCNKHKEWLEEWVFHKKEIVLNGYSNKWVVEHIHQLIDKTIVCCCSPKRCHGDYLAYLAKEFE